MMSVEVSVCCCLSEWACTDASVDRGGTEAALKSLGIPVLVVGIDSDLLYPVAEQVSALGELAQLTCLSQERLHSLIPGSKLAILSSDHGHDGFLLEQDQLSEQIDHFLVQNSRISSKL